MKIEYDQNKCNKNIKERGLSFELAIDFDIETADIKIDYRQIKNELRFNAVGFINDRIYHITYTLRYDAVRIISLRKANNREIKRYAAIH